MRKNLIIGLTVIFVISVLGLIFSGRKQGTQIEEVKIFPVSRQKESAFDLNKSWTTNYKPQAASSSLGLIFEKTALEQNRKTFQEIGIKFEEIKQSLKQAIKSTEQPFSSPSQISPAIPPKIVSALSEKEIFVKLYPDYFTNGLAETQKVFLERGFLDANYQKIENFDTEKKILSFVNTGIDVFEKQGWYSKEETKKFRKGANEIWKDLMKKERLELQQQLIKSEFYKNIFASKINYLNKLINKKILAEFKKIILPKVYADYINSGDCYKSGSSSSKGSNVYAFCCDCGLKCGKKGCDFVDKCGEGGCDVDLGCLNAVATKKQSAIWDSETGICGVG